MEAFPQLFINSTLERLNHKVMTAANWLNVLPDQKGVNAQIMYATNL